MSFTRNNPETVINELTKEFFVMKEYCKIPHKWQIAMPIMPKIMLIIFDFLSPSPQKTTAGKNPKINPPVAPKILENPAPNPENTGSPTVPSKM